MRIRTFGLIAGALVLTTFAPSTAHAGGTSNTATAAAGAGHKGTGGSTAAARKSVLDAFANTQGSNLDKQLKLDSFET